MDTLNLDKETLVSVYKNAHIALQSISDIKGASDDEQMENELKKEYDGYSKFIDELSRYMAERDAETKDINPLKKAAMFTAIKMNTLTDKSRGHIAELMVKGSVTGIIELTEILNNYGDKLEERTRNFVEELKALEERYQENLKKML